MCTQSQRHFCIAHCYLQELGMEVGHLMCLIIHMNHHKQHLDHYFN